MIARDKRRACLIEREIRVIRFAELNAFYLTETFRLCNTS